MSRVDQLRLLAEMWNEMDLPERDGDLDFQDRYEQEFSRFVDLYYSQEYLMSGPGAGKHYASQAVKAEAARLRN